MPERCSSTTTKQDDSSLTLPMATTLPQYSRLYEEEEETVPRTLTPSAAIRNQYYEAHEREQENKPGRDADNSTQIPNHNNKNDQRPQESRDHHHNHHNYHNDHSHKDIEKDDDASTPSKPRKLSRLSRASTLFRPKITVDQPTSYRSRQNSISSVSSTQTYISGQSLLSRLSKSTAPMRAKLSAMSSNIRSTINMMSW